MEEMRRRQVVTVTGLGEMTMDMVMDVILKALVEKFKFVVDSPSSVVRKEVLDNVEAFVSTFCVDRMVLKKQRRQKLARFKACFKTAAQAGVFTAVDPSEMEKCMCLAAVSNLPDLVLFLYHCGSLSSGQFFRMMQRDIMKAIGSQDPALAWNVTPRSSVKAPFDEEAKNTARGIKRFLTKQASNPFSLKKMCLQHVSRQVGWGHGREEKIRELHILDTLKDELRFKGLETVLKKDDPS